jgi:flagellar transcriptional activator FlhD
LEEFRFFPRALWRKMRASKPQREGNNVNTEQLHEEIKEANLSYLLLARQMIQDDQPSAIFRLGVSEEMADLLAGLSPAQLLKMAASDTLLCGFRFDEKLLLNMITDYNKDRMMSQAHTTILMAGYPTASLIA